MAPAIAHFLVGASLFLLFALPVCLRYEIEREHGLWLIPLGGLWGVTPDLHNIVPPFQRQLYAFHNSRWVDLFGLHYTLDRPIVRQQYLGSVFGSILVFCLAVGLFWVGFRAYDAVQTSHRDLDPVIVSGVSTVAGTADATRGMAVAVGLEAGFGPVALLVDSQGLIVGGLLLIPLGLGLGIVTAVGLEWLVAPSFVADPPTAALLGGGIGIATWLVGVVLLLPLWLEVLGNTVSIPFVHWESLVVCGIFGCVFGWMYGTVRGTLSPVGARRLWADSVD